MTRHAVVIGGAGYVGSAVLEALAEDDMSVWSIDLQPASAPARNVVSRLESVEAAATVVQEIVTQCGSIDVLVCASGAMSSADGDVESADESAFAESFETNVLVPWRTIRAVVPFMTDGGSIVVIGSLVAHRGSAHSQVAYTASKGAMTALAREAAVDLAVRGIRVNVVAPGPLQGGLFAPGLASIRSERLRLTSIPMQRRGDAHEVAGLVKYLANSDSSYMTGAHIPVDGGASAAFIAAHDPGEPS